MNRFNFTPKSLWSFHDSSTANFKNSNQQQKDEEEEERSLWKDAKKAKGTYSSEYREIK